MKKNFLLFSAVILAGISQNLHALGPSNFVEDQQPFIRSALIVSEKPVNRVRRGVLISLGENLWTCFDPDLLRYAAIWKTPAGKAPLSMDSMAGVSYPDAKAKAGKVPTLQGKLLASTPELPGVGKTNLPSEDIREGILLQGEGKVGPLPANEARWQGLELRGEDVVLSYRIGSRQILETSRALGPDLIERIISIEPGKETVAIRISGSGGKISGSGAIHSAVLEASEIPHLNIAGRGSHKVSSQSSSGVVLQIAASSKPGLFRILRSKEPLTKIPDFNGFPEPSPAKNIFPQKIEVTSNAPSDQSSPIAHRDLSLPEINPWNRAIRPTDIAFLSDGTALITTLDGDVWRVQDIEKDTATWTRAAFGIFEAMSIAINANDQVFVLGRDQITRLEDTDKDTVFDRYICASDAFNQTLHTRDYATSLELAADGAFLIARAGLANDGKDIFSENTIGRGSAIRISPDGTEATILADGLRVPFLGLRADGTVFASDQQGNFIPSSPIHIIGSDVPYLGYEQSDFRKKEEPTPPLLWFPYQINRSGSSFATLSNKAFPSLGDQFVHLSWSGRIFPVETPENGQPFVWKLPIDFDFPILGAASSPLNGRLYSVGIGISGYKPTTPRETGVAEVFENNPLAAPENIDIKQDTITVTFRSPLDLALSLLTPRPELDLWNIKRTKNYGSGHFRWDGKPGEHSVKIEKLDISPDRKTVVLSVPEIFRSDIMRLRLNFHNTASGTPPYQLELYARPIHLEEASSTDLAAVDEREKSSTVALIPGNAERGAALYINYGCVGCHSLAGEKLIGPPLNGIATRHPRDLEAYLRESIIEPTAVITEGYEASMPAFAGVIPEQDIEHLVAYLKNL